MTSVKDSRKRKRAVLINWLMVAPMKIISLNMRNFLSFGEEAQRLDFDSFNVIVGPNNSGKTNVLRTLSLVGKLFEDKTLDIIPFYYRGDLNREFEVRIGVEFDEEEREALSDYVTCASLMEKLQTTGKEDPNALDDLKKAMILLHGRKLFDQLFDSVFIEVLGKRQEASPFELIIRLGGDKRRLFIHPDGIITREPTSPRSYNSWNFTQILFDEIRLSNPEKVSDFLALKTKERPDFENAPKSVFELTAKKLDATSPSSILITGFEFSNFEAAFGDLLEFRRLRTFLRKRSYRKESANLYDVISAIYNSSLVMTSDIRTRPSAYLSSSNDMELHETEFYYLTGKELPLILFKLKNTSDPSQRRRYREILRRFSEISKGLEFDVTVQRRKISGGQQNELVLIPALPDMEMNSAKNDNLRMVGVRSKEKESFVDELVIQIVHNDFAVPLDLAAAGLAESLLLLIALIGQERKVILLDEPALNLHPNLQRKILELVNQTITSNNNQVILITHSPYLVDASQLKSAWRLSAKDAKTETLHIGRTIAEIDKQQDFKISSLLGSAENRSLLFSKGAIFVEGPSDKAIIEKLDKSLSLLEQGANIETNEWAVIPIGRKSSLGAFIKLSKKLGIPCAAILDYDSLMVCDETIKIESSEIKASPVLSSLYQNKILTPSEIEFLQKIEPSVGQEEYPSDYFNALFQIAKDHDIFVLSSDLEDLLSTLISYYSIKPLHILDAVLERIAMGVIPKEFVPMTEFLRKQVTGTLGSC
jgi:AAA15 family ATPase/GTPase